MTPRRQLTAFKVLAHLAWAASPWKAQLGPKHYRIQTAPWAASLGLSSTRLRQHLDFLNKEAWVEQAVYGQGWAEVKLHD